MKRKAKGLMVFVICICCLGTAYGNDTNQTDAEIIKKAVSEMKKYSKLADKETLNINRLVKAERSSSAMACNCLFIIPLNDKGKLDDYGEFEYIADLAFDDLINYASYSQGGSRAHIADKFIEQINKKFSNKIRLMNFIQKDLIVTLEFADGDKVVFDGYYNGVKESLNYWHRKYNPEINAKIIREAMLELKKFFKDREILNIKKLVHATWSSDKAISIISLNDKGERDKNAKAIDLVFAGGIPDMDLYGYLYGRSGRNSRMVEKFMRQINEKLSNNIPLINFIQKDLIVTLEFADGDKVIFDVYYDGIKEGFRYWCKKFNPMGTEKFACEPIGPGD